MRRVVISGLTAALVLAFMVTGYAWADEPKEGRLPEFSPEGAFCLTGPVFEKVRSVMSMDGADELGYTKFTQDVSLGGRYLTKVKFYYESQPAGAWNIETVLNFPFPAEVVYMAEQFKPDRYNAWIRVDFSALVSVTPAAGDFAGLSYALYVKEDGGDGTIENPGIMTCGGDDTCGYLEQTYNAPWLVAASNGRSWTTVTRSDFFEARQKFKVEVQVHLFAVHEAGNMSSVVVVNNGLLAFSSGVR